MSNLSRAYCAYFGEATEVWKRHVIGEIIVAFDEYRDSVCGTLQDADNSGPGVSTSGGQDGNSQEIFGGVQNVLENAQQQAEQRIVNAMNQTLNQTPVLHFSSSASIIANQIAHVNPPGESAISQGGASSGQNDDDDNSLGISIKSEVDSSSESECESDTDDDEMQVKEEPVEEEDITARSEEQTESANNNSSDNHEANDSQNDNSNETANEQVSNDHSMMIDGGEANLEEDPNGPIIVVVQYASPPSSPSNAEQSNISLEFNSRSNDDNQNNMDESEIASDDEIDHVDAEDDGDGDLEEDIDNMETEENDHSGGQESDTEGSMIDEVENDGEESDQLEEQMNMSGIEDNVEDDDEDSTDDTTDDDDEQAAGPSTSTGRRSTRQVSKRQIMPAGKSSKGLINAKKTEPLRVITKKLKCTVPGCKKVVKNKKAMNSHLLTSHKLKRYRCLVRRCFCKVSTSFTTKAQLSDHLDLVHGRTSRLVCHCSKEFNNYQELSSHYWLYHELGQFACSKNDCSFKPTSIRIKVQSHQYNHREAKYECLVDGCGKSFKLKGDLGKHSLTHSGERPFSCPECDKSFNLKSTLTVHLRIHRNDKCFRCTWPQCTHSASDHSAVIRHIRMVHFKLPRSKTQQAEEGIEDDRDPREYLAKD